MSLASNEMIYCKVEVKIPQYNRTLCNQLFHAQLYINSKEQHHASLLETNFGTKYLKNMHNKVCSVASTNNLEE